METSKEKIRHILQFLFDKVENTSHTAEDVDLVYGFAIATANYAQTCFRRFHSVEANYRLHLKLLKSSSPIVLCTLLRLP